MLKVLFSPLVLAGHFRGHCRCHALSFLYLCQCGLDSLLEALESKTQGTESGFISSCCPV